MVNRQHTTGTTRRRTLKKYYIYNKFLIQSLKMNKHFHIYNKRYLSYVIVFLFQYSYSSRDLLSFFNNIRHVSFQCVLYLTLCVTLYL